MKTTHYICSLLAAMALVLTAVPAGFAQESEIEACGKCHEPETKSFQIGHHAKAWSAKADIKGTCATCHGDGKEHIESDGQERMPISYTGRKATVAKANETCLSCHNTSGTLAFWNAGRHGKNDMTCGQCHNVHGRGSVKPGPDVCFTCHKDIKHDSMKASHHPMIEGKVSCNDCHNPHGTLNPKMMRAESVNQLCYKCHADKRGPYLWEHPPVEENCLSCHSAHGSRNQKLLVEKTPNLCQNCHEWSRHPATPYGATGGFASTGSTPFKTQLVSRSCLNCHSKIHGSYAPHNAAFGYNSGKYLLR